MPDPSAERGARMDECVRWAYEERPEALLPLPAAALRGIERLTRQGEHVKEIARLLNRFRVPCVFPSSEHWTSIEVSVVLALAGDPRTRALVMSASGRALPRTP